MGAIAGGSYKAATNRSETLEVMLIPIDKSAEEWGEKIGSNTLISRFPKLIVAHGAIDKIVSVKNSIELIEQWSQVNGVDAIEDETLLNYKTHSLNKISYSDTFGKEQIVYFQFLNVGHAILIKLGNDNDQGGELSLFTLEANYFSTYYILKEFGL